MDSESFFKGFWTAIKLGRHFVMGLISKFITRNGTYIAANDGADGYSTVTVDVTPEFTAADEGKVVENGALIAQTSLSVTENGTYNTTKNNEVVVNVGGGSAALFDYLNTLPLNDASVVITNEGGMRYTLDSINQTLQVTWNGGANIGIRYKPYFLVPASVNSVHYKIVTGSRSYDTSQRFAPGIGVLPKAELPYMKNGVEYDAVTNANKFLAIAYTQQRNHELEGVLDLSAIADDTALCLFVAGWDVTFSEIYFA